MFGIGPHWLFRSRWLALAWAIVICFAAVTFVASQERGGARTERADATAASNAMH